MKRFLISTLSAAVSVGMVTPAFAYIVKNDNIEVQTSPYHSGRPSRRIIMNRFGSIHNRPTIGSRRVHYGVGEREVAPVNTTRQISENVGGVYNRVRTSAEVDNSGRSLLKQRAYGRMLRRLNRTRKVGSDRYRILNLHPNRRSIRENMNESSFLPNSLVQTGNATTPRAVTSRAIRENQAFGRVNDRNRNILAEMLNSDR